MDECTAIQRIQNGELDAKEHCLFVKQELTSIIDGLSRINNRKSESNDSDAVGSLVLQSMAYRTFIQGLISTPNSIELSGKLIQILRDINEFCTLIKSELHKEIS